MLKILAVFRFYLLGTVLILVAGCTAAPIPTPTPPPHIGPFIPIGQPVYRSVETTTEEVRNCVVDGETIVKTPSRSIGTGHSVEWSVGGQSGVGSRIGEGILPFGVDLEASLNATYGRSIYQTLEEGTGWQLPAKANTIVTYILRWSEKWQPGYVEVRIGGIVINTIDVFYLISVTSEIEAEAVVFCSTPTSIPVAVPPTDAILNPTVLPTIAPTLVDVPTSTSNPRNVVCFGNPLPHHPPVVGEPWVLPDGGWIIVNFWSNEPGVDQTEHKLLLAPHDPRSFLGGGSAWQWSEECETDARNNLRANPLPETSLEELRMQNLVR